MKPNEEIVKAYKKMAEGADTMEVQIMRHLEANCQKFKGNEDKFSRCIEYVTDCAREILDGKNGDVPDAVCFRMASDYFDDEIWKKEDEEEAREKAEREKRDAEAKAKLSKKSKPKVATSKASLDKMLAADSTKADIPVQVLPSKTKPVEGQLDLFATLGV